uniref:Uncharacterized protein n=1 Tax=Yersinia enterocolitica TaxID=630 RepID=Q9X9H7_YEREN|nr:hypothetical protein [Yersinia enterocolitica]
MSPKINGICELFLKTILNEFYQVTFRKRCMVFSTHYNPILMNGSLNIR